MMHGETLEQKVELLRELKAAEQAVNAHRLARFEWEDAGRLTAWVAEGKKLTQAVNVLRKKLGRTPQPNLFRE